MKTNWSYKTYDAIEEGILIVNHWDIFHMILGLD